MIVELTHSNVRSVIVSLLTFGHKEDSENLTRAYEEFKRATKNLQSGYPPGSGIPLSDLSMDEAHQIIENSIIEYHDAFEELQRAWKYHLGLITIKTPEEMKNA